MPGAPKWFARASVSSVRPRLDSPIRPISSLPETRHHAYRFTHIGAFMSASSSAGPLAALSDDLAAAVDTVGRSVVAIHARRRIPSSGVVWQPGVIVAAHHTINRDDDITVTLASGRTAAATLAGRDPSTDLAVLRVADAAVPPVERGADGDLQVGRLVLAL